MSNEYILYIYKNTNNGFHWALHYECIFILDIFYLPILNNENV